MRENRTLILNGIAHPPRYSEVVSAELSLGTDERVTLQVEDDVIDAHLSEIKASSAVGNLRTEVLFPNGWLFIAKEQHGIQEARRLLGLGSWLQKLEANGKVIVLAVIMMVAVIFGSFRFGIPWLSDKTATLLPDSVSEYLGENVLAQLDKQLFSPSALSGSRQLQISEKFTQHIEMLKKAGEDYPHSPKLVFRNAKGVANAFALSDGTIVLTDSLTKLMENDQQLDSVIFHELGHIYHEHVMKSVVHSSLLSVSVALLTGESSGLIDNLTGVGIFLFTTGYSREEEQEADQYGARMMRVIYGTTEPMQRAFELLQSLDTSVQPEWISSHPDMDSRIEAVNH